MPLRTAPLEMLVEIALATGVNVALQVVLAVIIREPVVQPVPLQPAKTEPVSGVAIRAIAVPLMKVAEQLLAQSIPDGTPMTVPVPVPEWVTVSV